MVRKVLLMALGCITLGSIAALAQAPGNDFKYSAPKVTLRTNGARLDGTAAQPAHISSPELDVTALTIAFDYSQNQIQQIRAIGTVKLRLELAGKNGAPATHVEASSDSATLNPLQRQLTLNGNVDGFYQVGDSPRTTLAGNQAILQQVNGLITAALQGPVRLVIPPESTTNNPGALGTVVITAENATLDEAKGQAIFSGNAHAVSTDTANQFDVTAPQFILTRLASGAIDTLSTQGHTLVKIDLPPQPAAPLPPAGATATTSGPSKTSLGQPTHVEVTSDAATVSRLTSTLTFTGHVTGFYVLSPPNQPSQRYNFSGDKAVLSQPATADGSDAGLHADITGQPVTIFAPGLSFDMNGAKP